MNVPKSFSSPSPQVEKSEPTRQSCKKNKKKRTTAEKKQTSKVICYPHYDYNYNYNYHHHNPTMTVKYDIVSRIWIGIFLCSVVQWPYITTTERTGRMTLTMTSDKGMAYALQDQREQQAQQGQKGNGQDYKHDDDEDNENFAYGVDVSLPMQHPWGDDDDDATISTSTSLSMKRMNHRKKFYRNLMDGCQTIYDEYSCKAQEQIRIERNAIRPSKMVNFTKNGFIKIKTPPELWKLVQNYWLEHGENKENENWVLETWQYGQGSINHWDAPAYMVSLHNGTYFQQQNQNGDNNNDVLALENAIWKGSQRTLEEWTGQKLVGCSLYGIRVYTRGAILMTHVDRLPLISSAIINVAQKNMDEPWPLEVIGHDGMAHNVTMVPGDMILYESHSILHGRPFPLQGDYMANIFVHFEPFIPDRKNYDNENDNGSNFLPYVSSDKEFLQSELYEKLIKERYIHWKKFGLTHPHTQRRQQQNSNERQRQQQQQHEQIQQQQQQQSSSSSSSSSMPYNPQDVNPSYLLHYLAAHGLLTEIKHLLKNRGLTPQQQIVLLERQDDVTLGWTPFHEAAKGGHINVLSYLLQEHYHVINMLNYNHETATSVAERYHGRDSDIVQYLVKHGGKFSTIAPASEKRQQQQMLEQERQRREKRQQQQQQQQHISSTTTTARTTTTQTTPTMGILTNTLAAKGQMDELHALVNRHPHLITSSDVNGWMPIHEAARGGHVHVVRYLLQQGAPINAQTSTGGTPLYYAIKYLGHDNPVVELLNSMGGIFAGPEL